MQRQPRRISDSVILIGMRKKPFVVKGAALVRDTMIFSIIADTKSNAECH
jgi:hypothetical protein